MTETLHFVIKAFNKSFCHKIKENKENNIRQVELQDTGYKKRAQYL